MLYFGSFSLLVSALLLILSALVKRPDPRLHLRDRPRKDGQLTSDKGYVLLGGHFRPEVYGRWGKSHPSRPGLRTPCLKLTPTAPRNSALRSLAGADDEECNGDVLAGDRDEGERVEELVVAKYRRHRVWPAPRVDDGPGRIGEPAHPQ